MLIRALSKAAVGVRAETRATIWRIRSGGSGRHSSIFSLKLDRSNFLATLDEMKS